MKTSPFQPLKPTIFMPGMNIVGNNPFAPKPVLKTDVVSTSSNMMYSSPGAASSPTKFVLRPSALSTHLHNLTEKEEVKPVVSSISSILKPAKLPDPTKGFGHKVEHTDTSKRSEKENQADSSVKERPREASSDISSSRPEDYSVVALKERVPDSSSPNDSNVNTSNGAPIFGQNLTEKVTGVYTSSNGAVSSTGFVFGENLAERVIHDANALAASNSPSKAEESSQSPDSTELTISEKAQTLEESAREYQAMHDRKRKLKEVEILTGEEDESNVLQANAKLFVFDSLQQTWIERGRGLIRLNDMKTYDSISFQSRIVMRTHGSLRVILNTKIWPGMMVERASQKSIRLTGTDGEEGVKVFLLVTNLKDNETILRALDWRIQQLRVDEEKSKHEHTSKGDKRKAEPESPIEEFEPKKIQKTDDDISVSLRREESDSSVLDPETEASSESHASSFTLRTDSD
ncbi:hypothetical protein ACJMK2_042358 [Sinanodonta woodiana]